MKTTKPVLLIEDDKIDVMLTRKVFEENEINNNLLVAENGEVAIDILENVEDELPGIIFLDLNMPRMNGIEFLSVIKKHNKFRNIPVIILTTSKNEQDIEKCFGLGVAGYITKPTIFEDYLEAIKIVNQYWKLSEIPKNF